MSLISFLFQIGAIKTRYRHVPQIFHNKFLFQIGAIKTLRSLHEFNPTERFYSRLVRLKPLDTVTNTEEDNRFLFQIGAIKT